MKAYLEHANIAVNDLAAALQFFQTAFPEFEIRHQEETWAHIGTDDSYLAIQTIKSDDSTPRKLYYSRGINHLGFVVENVAALGERLEKAGYERSYAPTDNSPHRRREYFYDKERNEYEFVEYFSDKTEERNAYNG